MADVIFHSFEMEGVKSSFADWISNISPEYTPFTSMIAKFPVKNTRFQWQTDNLKDVDMNNAVAEGDNAQEATLTATEVHHNFTQILRKVVSVSDTANAVSSYGREKELFYQLKKASKEIKRDLETILLLKDQKGVPHSVLAAGRTASLGDLISDDSSVATGVDPANWVDVEKDLFELTRILYTNGAEAGVILYNPVFAKSFSALQEKVDGRVRIFQNDKRFVKQVETIVDPLGQELKCVPNRWMPKDIIYIIDPSDISLAVLRAPKQEKLDKAGSSELYLIEQEVGLRLNNPKAAGKITFGEVVPELTGFDITYTATDVIVGATLAAPALSNPVPAGAQIGANQTYASGTIGVATVDADGVVTGVATGTSVITCTDTDSGAKSTVTITVKAAKVKRSKSL